MIRATLENEKVYALDFTGTKFGIYEPIMLWDDYARKYIAVSVKHMLLDILKLALHTLSKRRLAVWGISCSTIRSHRNLRGACSNGSSITTRLCGIS